MKLKNLLAGVGIALPFLMSAQTDITGTTPQSYLSRGVQLYQCQNFCGAIDQLSHLRNMKVSANVAEEADYYIALSLYEQGRECCIDYLHQFLENYPSSVHKADVWATIGNYYFYTGRYGEALGAYVNVNEHAFNSDKNDDILYRKAYSELRLGHYDIALMNFKRLSGSKRYRDAAQFYDAYIAYANKDYDKAEEMFLAVDRKGELGYNAQYYLCQLYFRKGEFNKVRSLGSALLADKNGSEMDNEIVRLLGETNYHEGDEATAEKLLNQYIDNCKTSPEHTSEYILGLLDYRHGEYSKAIERLGGATNEDNALGQSAYYFIGQSYRKLNQTNSAAMAFEKACNMNYDRNTQEAAFYNYAVMQNEGSRTPFSKTIDMFEDFLNRFPNSKYTNEVEEYMTTVYMTSNDYDRALKSISHIKNPSATVLKAKQNVLYNLGVQALSNDKVPTATKYFTDARALGKYDSTIANQTELWLGECYYRSGKYSSAEKCLTTYVNGAKASDKNYPLGCYDLGYARFQQRKYADARTAFEKAVNAKGLSSNLIGDAYNRIGDTYYYGKSFAAAENYYDKAYKQNKNSGDYSLYQKGMMAGLNRDFGTKISQMDELQREYPSSTLVPAAMLEQADAYVLSGNSSKGISTYKKLINNYPKTSYGRKGLLQLAITQRSAGSESEAVSTYKQIISKYPTSEEAKVATEDLKLIYADKGELKEFASYVNSIPNAPKLNVSEVDRLTFEAAEKAYIHDNSSISKMQAYLKNYPNGAYASRAKYYLAKHSYNKGNYNEALASLDKLIPNSKDASFIEDALAMKSDILAKQGKNKEALASYKQLAEKASTADNRITARLGMLRIASKSGDNNEVISCANELLKNGGLSAEEEKEVVFSRAQAYAHTGKSSLAVKDYTTLSKDTRNLYGAQSAYYLAESQFNAGNTSEAEKTLNRFIDEGTPHQYWLARGFILLSDIYHKKGDNFEACEYLESLKNNYPGKESDIFNMISERLNKWKKSSTTTSDKTTNKSSKKK